MNACRFPKLEECAHFHYELVELIMFHVKLVKEGVENKEKPGSNSYDKVHKISRLSSCSNQIWFMFEVNTKNCEQFFIRRSFENVQELDEMLHRCVFDRQISKLTNLSLLKSQGKVHLDEIFEDYFERLSNIANNSITCGKILTWFQLDNKGRKLILGDACINTSINIPAVGAAYGVKRYSAQACDEISIEIGDMIAVIDMPSSKESIWWRGKKNHLKNQYEVGFFPQNCVAMINEKIPRNITILSKTYLEIDLPLKPVLKKRGKVITLFRSFILSRPSRGRLKQKGIYRERIFSCDLSEHLLNSGQSIPHILEKCACFLEENGIVDGIYRLSGITSNVQKLRRAFDEENFLDCTEEMNKDIYAVSSVLKMYFRELPNPLFTYQLYDSFVSAIQNKQHAKKCLTSIRQIVSQIPPPHYRTLKYLSHHLYKMSKYSQQTGMTERNLAIVWAPNLLRNPDVEKGGITALKGVGIQAVVTEYFIKNYELIFQNDNNDSILYNQDDDLILLSSNFENYKSNNASKSNISNIMECTATKLKDENLVISIKKNDYIGNCQSLSKICPILKYISLSWQSLSSNNVKSNYLSNYIYKKSNVATYMSNSKGKILKCSYHCKCFGTKNSLQLTNNLIRSVSQDSFFCNLLLSHRKEVISKNNILKTNLTFLNDVSVNESKFMKQDPVEVNIIDNTNKERKDIFKENICAIQVVSGKPYCKVKSLNSISNHEKIINCKNKSYPSLQNDQKSEEKRPENFSDKFNYEKKKPSHSDANIMNNSPQYSLLTFDSSSESSDTTDLLHQKSSESTYTTESLRKSNDPYSFTILNNEMHIKKPQRLNLDINSYGEQTEKSLVISGNSSPVASNNTSLSITPSEFSYMNITKQSNITSLESSPNITENDVLQETDFFSKCQQSGANLASSNIETKVVPETLLRRHIVHTEEIEKNDEITKNYRKMNSNSFGSLSVKQIASIYEMSFDCKNSYKQRNIEKRTTEINVCSLNALSYLKLEDNIFYLTKKNTTNLKSSSSSDENLDKKMKL